VWWLLLWCCCCWTYVGDGYGATEWDGRVDDERACLPSGEDDKLELDPDATSPVPVDEEMPPPPTPPTAAAAGQV